MESPDLLRRLFFRFRLDPLDLPIHLIFHLLRRIIQLIYQYYEKYVTLTYFTSTFLILLIVICLNIFFNKLFIGFGLQNVVNRKYITFAVFFSFDKLWYYLYFVSINIILICCLYIQI